METFTLVDEAQEPFKKFKDFQDYADSQNNEDFEAWEVELSQDSPTPKFIVTSLSLYINEVGANTRFTEDEVMEICERFRVSIGLAQLVRDGSMKQTGRLMLHRDDSATFTMTDKGISSVEKMLKKK